MPVFLRSADALQRAWLDGVHRRERKSQQEVVASLLRELDGPTPQTFYALLDLLPYHLLRKRVLNRYYPSVVAWTWQTALQMTHPARVIPLAQRFEQAFLAQNPKSRRRLDTMTQHLAQFSVLTDNFLEEGFLSVAHHVVIRVWGDRAQQPNNLFCSVRLANDLDTRYHTYVDQFTHMEIESR